MLYLVYEYRIRHPFESKLDRETIQLTGDPFALITAHHFTAAFDGKPLIFDGKQPEKEKRIWQLVTMGNQLWPRAPYASEPVPTVITITCDGYQITAPPTAVTEPASVPIEPYGAMHSK
ncbi:hypothetical protein [Ktedonospora formicarum]|uniref:Uncharacterized protein n=1 Tax=Ktedonospora formicarum TaxID=2778364 RepID=A0A8J3MYF0_9CHLR|nr:hypothetical protein [Ktedonospora formicarum]GHO49580.1 hypothetical protein KSX_77430 [Ktedonospora formicarum]